MARSEARFNPNFFLLGRFYVYLLAWFSYFMCFCFLWDCLAHYA